MGPSHSAFITADGYLVILMLEMSSRSAKVQTGSLAITTEGRLTSYPKWLTFFTRKIWKPLTWTAEIAILQCSPQTEMFGPSAGEAVNSIGWWESLWVLLGLWATATTNPTTHRLQSNNWGNTRRSCRFHVEVSSRWLWIRTRSCLTGGGVSTEFSEMVRMSTTRYLCTINTSSIWKKRRKLPLKELNHLVATRLLWCLIIDFMDGEAIPQARLVLSLR